MEVVHLPPGRSWGPDSAPLRLSSASVDSESDEVLNQELDLHHAADKLTTASKTSPPYDRISDPNATVVGRLVQDCDSSQEDSNSQSRCALNRNFSCSGCFSCTGSRSRHNNREKSDSISGVCTNTVLENNVLSDRHGGDQHNQCSCLCNSCPKSAILPLSIISSARLFFASYSTSFSSSSSSSLPPRHPPPLARSLSAKLFLLVVFCCVLHGVAASETVVRASAGRSACPSFPNEQAKALMADVVIEGRVRKSPPPSSNPHVIVRKSILKDKNLVARGVGIPNRLRIGPFTNKTLDGQNCLASVTKGRTYFFYFKDISDREGLRFEIMATPARRTRNLARSLNDILCRRCARAPSIRNVRVKSKEVKPGDPLKLRCGARGKPDPTFVWYKDGVEIKPSSGLTIKMNSRRTSKLVIRKATYDDRGVYTCAAVNVVGEDRKNVTVSVRLKRLESAYLRRPVSSATTATTTVRVVQPKSQPCRTQTYCLNGGECLYIASLDRQMCRCTEQWSGRRCELVDGLNVREDYFRQSTLLYERTLIIIGIVIAALVFIVICIASYFLAKARRKRFEQRRRRREAKRAARELEAAPPKEDKRLANDVSLKDSPHRLPVQTAGDSSTVSPPPVYPAQHDIHPLLLKKQQQQQQRQQQQLQQQQQQHSVEDEPDPQLEALLRSCDPNHQSKPDASGAGERPESRKRLAAASYETGDTLPSTFKACVDRKETTTAAILHTTEDIEMNNMESNGKVQRPYTSQDPGSSGNGNSGIEEDAEWSGTNKEDVSASFSSMVPDVSSPPLVSSPTSSSYSQRPTSSGSLSPPPYHRAVYIPSPSHHQAGDDESPEDEAANIPLLSVNEARDLQAPMNDGSDQRHTSPRNSQYQRTAFQKPHAPLLNNIRDWSSAPCPTNVKGGNPSVLHRSNDTEKAYDSDEDMITERDNLLGNSSRTSPPLHSQMKKNKSPHGSSTFPTASSVSHSNTFPKPSKVNGVVRGGSTSNNIYSNNNDDDSSSSDENDEPGEFPYQKQRDDLYIAEEDLDLSKENLASTSFSSDMPGIGRMSRQLSRQESKDMEEPVVGLLPSQNLKPPRDQLRKYPSEEGPAYTILACKAQGLHLLDDNRSKSLDDPLVSAIMTGSSTNATGSTSSLSTSPYGSANHIMNGIPHYNNYHYPGQQSQHVRQPGFEGGSRLHSTQVGSPMVETYGENDDRFGFNSSQNPTSFRSRPFAYDPSDDGRPWDNETATTQDKGNDMLFQRGTVEGDEDNDEKEKLQRLKDVYPDQPAIPI
ncbi:hypothetical protein EGW08_011391 [Elysia chlorotica]|uniref:Pro-neuregulin-2, membrane-bound n=1 Tax=Elysia chlorotica TaxID=188477 RepID=A0A433TH48_ELYCH|nr:hypothetical protein EGW08_011391 [Elysia chlorotica]